MEAKLKHLEFLQNLISRMATNSFLIKGWSITLVSALFVLSGKDNHFYFVYLAYFPAITFWILDGYFLRQERLFRALYNKVRLLDPAKIDFSMDTNTVKDDVDSWQKVIVSKTLRIFHLTIIFAIIIVMLLFIFLK